MQLLRILSTGFPGRARSDAPRGRRRGATALASALALFGTALTVFVSIGIAHNDARQSREAFRESAAQIAGRLTLAIEHENDLIEAVGAYLREDPRLSTGEFYRWVGQLRAMHRYRELFGVAIIRVVPAAELASWAAYIDRYEPVPGLKRAFTLTPAGRRPYYCLASAGISRTPLPEGADFCALDPLGFATRSSGQTSAYAIDLPGAGHVLGVFLPVYRSAITPATVAARRAQFIGWVGSAIAPTVLLARALEGAPDKRVELERVSGSALNFGYGPVVAHPHRVLVNLHDGSVVEISGTVAGTSLFAHAGAEGTLVAGTGFSLLLALLLLVLATGRARALTLVEEKTEQLAFQALHDALSGLPNRALVLDRTEQALVRSKRTQHPAAVLFLDVDGFKQVNDTLGHSAGDELLRVIGTRLQSVVRESDTVGRLGGDEFVVLLEANDLYVAPELVAERILEVLRQPIVVDGGHTTTISASIGIASGLRDSAEELLRDADLALYAAKSAGRDQYAFFEDAMHVALADRYQLEQDLREAIVREELFVVYQPCFDLGSGAATGAEALIRWQHGSRGLVVPDQFIPLAEETGLIVEIGRWVLGQACAQAASWHATGYPMFVSVNVSARQIEQEDFVAVVEDILADTGLRPSSLTLEITETVLMRDPEISAQRLSALKALGVRIAIDDFGTGYSSLGYLRRLPVDALKIDRSFVSGTASIHSVALMQTLVRLGKTLGLEVVGEGIEDDAQLATLRAANCDCGQGFLFARPLSAKAIEEFFISTAPAG